jgi:hypothetical protein
MTKKCSFILGDAYGLGVFSAIRMNVVSWKTSHELEILLKPGLVLLLSVKRASSSRRTWAASTGPALSGGIRTFRAYREFCTAGDILAKLAGHRWKSHWIVNGAVGFGYSAFARFAVSKRMHPMAGGFCRMNLDKVDNYLPLRKRVFGINRLEMPTSLSLAAD